MSLTHFPTKVGCPLDPGPRTYYLKILISKIILKMSLLLVLRLIFYHQGRLPVKWTAYEALMFNTYTTKSDVWVNRIEIAGKYSLWCWILLSSSCFSYFTNQRFHFIFSWSYGVVLYEIFTVGKLLFFSWLAMMAFVVEVSFTIDSVDVVCLNSYIFRWFSLSANGWQENF